MIEKIKGNIFSVQGFKGSSLFADIKGTGNNDKPDLALIFSEEDTLSAGVFTVNKFQAAPVQICKKRLPGNIRAIIINSGNANCATGQKGYKGAMSITDALANKLGLNKNQVLISSTGVIGKEYPAEKIKSFIPLLIDNLSKKADIREAIMTTDSKKKGIAFKFKIGEKICRIGGIAKGSGMIRPNMATMLSFITSDISITKEMLTKSLKKAVSKTFNRISVDGDMSTNDSVIIMTNSVAGNKKISIENDDYFAFYEALYRVLDFLAEACIRDGEGSTKYIEINVTKAKNEKEAVRVGTAVGNSLLVKTALFGEDANWGRIISAIGSTGITLSKMNLELYVNGYLLFKGIEPVQYDEAKLLKSLKNKDIKINIILGQGDFSAIYRTSDISYDYVKINADYRT